MARISPLVLSLVVFGLRVGAQSADADPFGLRIGMTRTELAATATIANQEPDGTINLSKVPRPHAAFQAYAVTYTERYGVCRIMAIGRTIAVNAFGDALRREFEEISTQLDSRYGTSELIDRLQPGSIWDEPKDWTMALLKDERTLMRRWVPTAAFPSLKAIYLGAHASSLQAGALVLSFEGQNIDSCRQDQRSGQSSAF